MKSTSEKRKMIDKGRSKISITNQCKLLNLNKSSLYYKPVKTSSLNLKLAREIDAHYLKHPDKGARRMHVWLTKDLTYNVSKNRIERIYYKQMGLRSLLPGPHTSKRNKRHKVYPYLLKDLKVTRPNQVWQTDISYIPILDGFMYLTAVIDVYSRYVVHWSISNSMEAQWCTDFIKEAFDKNGKPDILNTDQGAQYTSDSFTNAVLNEGVRLSMDGKGRATDNAFIERLWRSVKYEKLYLFEITDGIQLYKYVDEYFKYYNYQRRHSSIEDQIPSVKYPYLKQPVSSSRAA